MFTKITIMSAPAASDKNREQVWNRNTEFCVDLKTVLHSDPIARPGKDYRGVLRLDREDHFTFTETASGACSKRNPHVFEGKYITVTRRADGTYHPNFRPLRAGRGFSVNDYAVGVCRELHKALKGLVEE